MALTTLIGEKRVVQLGEVGVKELRVGVSWWFWHRINQNIVTGGSYSAGEYSVSYPFPVIDNKMCESPNKAMRNRVWFFVIKTVARIGWIKWRVM